MQRSSRPFALWRRPSSRARGYLHSPLEPVLVNMVPGGEGGKRLPWRRAWPRESRRSADFPPLRRPSSLGDCRAGSFY